MPESAVINSSWRIFFRQWFDKVKRGAVQKHLVKLQSTVLIISTNVPVPLMTNLDFLIPRSYLQAES
jgi:hypothetical protein